MKKIKYFLLLVALLFVLVACEEIEVDPEVRSPEIELKNEGDLNQLFEETEDLDDITFTLVLKYFQDNNLAIEDLSIKWYHGAAMVEENTLTHLVEIKHTLNLNVKVTVTFTLKGLVKTLTEEAVISVTERPTQITISNGIDNTTHTISAIIGVHDSKATYRAVLRNNLSHTSATWKIVKRDDFLNEIETIEIPVNLSEEMVNDNGEGILEVEIDFNEYGIGNYMISLIVGKYESNYQHFIYSYESLILTIETGDAVQTENFSDRLLTTNTLSESVGEGIYKWYVNGIEILSSLNGEYTHTEIENGGYLYYVEFHPLNTEIPVLVSEPILIANVVEVNDLTELEQAINKDNDDVKAVILTDDILLTNAIQIRKAFTIIGGGYNIYSEAIPNLIEVYSDDVYFKDLTISHSKSYNLIYNSSKNGYVENVTFIKPGMLGGMTDLSAAIFVLSSDITVKNITILEGRNTGIRIDTPKNNDKKSNLRILGTIETDGLLLLPIGSGSSIRDDVSVQATGYVMFVIPLPGNSAIIRWSDESEAISWTLNNPNKTEYLIGEDIDVIGISIDVKLPGMEFKGELEFVYLFFDMFSQHGTLEILNLDFVVLDTYYIVGHNLSGNYNDIEYVFGEDLLLYTLDKEGLEYARPTLNFAPGEYLIRITVGGEMNLGNFKITINE